MTSAREVCGEAYTVLAARPLRALLVSAGTSIGVAMLVTTIGLATTTRAQIGSQFNSLTATEVSVTSTQDSGGKDPLPRSTAALAQRIHGVTAAGLFSQVQASNAGWRNSWRGSMEVPANLYAADPSTLDVIEPVMQAGRRFTLADDANSVNGVMLSESLAHQLGINAVVPPTQVFLGDTPVLVLGIYSNVAREPQTALGAIASVRTATELFGSDALSPTGLVATYPGSAQVVAAQLPIAIRPDDPSKITAIAPPSSTFLRRSVNGDVQRLLLLLAAVAIVIGTFGIANAMLVSVLERVPEIGLRRALGAQRLAVATQFLVEGAITGTVGGILGFAIGVVTTVGLSAANHWTPTLDLSSVALLPLAGSAAGTLAAIYPAWKAASVAPARALQH